MLHGQPGCTRIPDLSRTVVAGLLELAVPYTSLIREQICSCIYNRLAITLIVTSPQIAAIGVMTANLYELSVLINGRPIREYGHEGLTFVEGRKDQNYSLRFCNNSSQRVLAVVSIDGIGVVDGKAATPLSRGYVIPAYSSSEISGWRSSLAKIHDFVFDPKAEAYSSQVQETDVNCGIIEVKVFAENLSATFNKTLNQLAEKLRTNVHIHYPPPMYTPPSPTYTPSLYTITTCCSTTPGANPESSDICHDPSDEMLGFKKCSTPAQELPDFNLGTAWGKERDSIVSEVEFERGIEVADLRIYYSDADGLKKSGIEVSKKAAITKSILPQGFNGFCSPPKITKQ
jgi:hypothetical protein